MTYIFLGGGENISDECFEVRARIAFMFIGTG